MNAATNETTAAMAFNEANAAYKTGDWQQALLCAENALAAHAGLVPAHFMKARCLVKLGQAMAAREAFAQTLRLDAGQFSVWLEAGHLCKQMGELV